MSRQDFQKKSWFSKFRKASESSEKKTITTLFMTVALIAFASIPIARGHSFGKSAGCAVVAMMFTVTLLRQGNSKFDISTAFVQVNSKHLVHTLVLILELPLSVEDIQIKRMSVIVSTVASLGSSIAVVSNAAVSLSFLFLQYHDKQQLGSAVGINQRCQAAKR